jgi:hypothetical protein
LREPVADVSVKNDLRVVDFNPTELDAADLHVWRQ